MSRNVPGLTLAYKATAAIAARTIVKHGAADGSAVAAAAATDALLGVSADIDAAGGESVDVIRSGVTPVRYGGAVARGDALTANASGAAVKAVAGNQVIGYAEVSGVAGDIGSLLIQRGIA